MKYSIKNTLSLLLSAGLVLIILGGWCNLAFAEIGDDPSTSNNNKGYTLLAPLPGTTQDCAKNKNGKIDCTTDIQTYIPGIFNLTIGIAGVLAVLMILIGGVEYITTDAIQGKHDGKKRINNALLGLLLVLVSWILLRTINPKLTEFNLAIKSTTATKSGETTTEYTGTAAEIASKESTESSTNAEGYVVSKHTKITEYEDVTESSVVTETYIDKDGNTHTTKTTKNREGVYSTEERLQLKGSDDDATISKDGSSPNYNFDGWGGN